MKQSAGIVVLFLAALVVTTPGRPQATAENIFHYGFETRDPIWVRGTADAPFKETAHRLTEEKAHDGTRSELIEVEAEQGNYIHYTYDIGRAPVTDELNVGLWLQSNRPGIQLLCRIVLPHERDPKQPDQLLTVLVKAEPYALVGRWQKVSLRQPDKRLREQQQLLRAQQQRDVQIGDAYIDRLVLNVYGGAGITQVYTDDLEVGPLEDLRSAQPTRPGMPAVNPGGGPPPNAGPRVDRQKSQVQLRDNKLTILEDLDGKPKPLFMRAIRHTGTPLKTLSAAGFNTIVLDETTPPGLIEDAVNLGFWIVPTLRPADGRPVTGVQTSQQAFGQKVAFFLNQEAVQNWNLGMNLSSDQYPTVLNTVKALRALDPMRPVSADVLDGFLRYSRGIEQLMLGIHRWPLMTSLELTSYRDFLSERRMLAVPNTYCWTWVQTHLPDDYAALVYDQLGPDPKKEPIGPQPEQIRLLAWTAIGAGYRGLGFWSDRYLADPVTGKDRLLTMALLNQELQMLEPLLATAGRPEWIDTSSPNVKAAVLHCDKAVLVVPMWLGGGAQCVPGQSAQAVVDITVPHVPNGCQCWEVSPGGLRSHPWQRVTGGLKVRLREFSMVCPLVFTSDLGPNGLVVRFQDHQRQEGQKAAQWAYDQAQEELTKVEQVEAQLKQAGHEQPDETQLLQRTREYLESAKTHQANHDWAEAFADAQRAVRPLRILMRAQWEDAVKKLTTPVASPYAMSYFTLPRHWAFLKETENTHWGANLLPDGGFEVPPDQVQQGWLRQESPSPDQVITIARRVAETPDEGRQCLKLQVIPKDPLIAPTTLERTYVAVHTPAVQLPPGTLVRISASVRAADGITGSADGALFYDSAGGDALAYRVNGGLPKWKKLMLYRRVPATGSINVTMALTGLGIVYFDSVRIEPLAPGAAPTPRATVASQVTPER